VDPDENEVEGARVATPGVVEQVCQVEKEGETCAGKSVAPGLLVKYDN
jgi:hypothetical protein